MPLNEKGLSDFFKYAPGKTLTAAALLDGFRHAPEHPLWKSIMAELALFRESCVQGAKLAVTDRDAAMAQGGLDTLDKFRDELENRVKESRQDDGE